MQFTSEQRYAKLISYAQGYSLLTEAIQKYPREMWQYRMAPNEFTIHEVLVHISDSEANSYVRCRRFIAEPGSMVLSYDEMSWAQHLDYHRQSTDTALAVFKWLRQATYDLIKDLSETVWDTHSIVHSENGDMTFDDWLLIYEDHVPSHIRQMEEIYQHWLAHSDNV